MPFLRRARVTQDAVDRWTDARGRAILRAAFGLDHGTVRGRANRLDLLAVDLSKSSPRRDELTADSLDTLFTRRLAYEFAATMLADERTARGRRSLWVWGVVAMGLLVSIGLLLLILLTGNPPDEGTEEPVFEPSPVRCSIEVCNSEETAVTARTQGFEPGGSVGVEIFVPSGPNANDLGSPYTYRDELSVNPQGSFTWRYWWDPGMETGVYRVRITDQSRQSSVESKFEFSRAAPSS